MRLEPIVAPSWQRRLIPPAAAILATFVIAALLAQIAGGNPFSIFGLILSGALGSKFAILETLNRATPLIFTGLAVAVAFRAKLWNIGAEGQYIIGAICGFATAVETGSPLLGFAAAADPRTADYRKKLTAQLF